MRPQEVRESHIGFSCSSSGVSVMLGLLSLPVREIACCFPPSSGPICSGKPLEAFCIWLA